MHRQGENKLTWNRSLRISLYERSQQAAKATGQSLQVHIDMVVKATRDADTESITQHDSTRVKARRSERHN